MKDWFDAITRRYKRNWKSFSRILEEAYSEWLFYNYGVLLTDEEEAQPEPTEPSD